MAILTYDEAIKKTAQAVGSVRESIANISDIVCAKSIPISPTLISGKGILYNSGDFYEATTYSYGTVDVDGAVKAIGTLYFANDFGIAFYDTNGNYIIGYKNETPMTFVYTLDVEIPSGAKTMRFSHRNTQSNSPDITLTYLDLEKKVKVVNSKADSNKLEIDTLASIVNVKNNRTEVRKESFVPVETMSIDAPNTKSGNIITFSCKIDQMSTVVIGHGSSPYVASSIRIRNNTVELHRKDSEDVLVKTITHGLTFTNVLTAIIETKRNNKAVFTLASESGFYHSEEVEWFGSAETVYAKAFSGSYTDCILTYYCKDIEKPVWIFGDSYMSQWNVYAEEYGAENYLNESYSGRNSNQAIASLEKDLSNGTPKIIVWAMGMNDQEKVSWGLTQWQNGYTRVKNLCDAKNIELILVTIPNTPTMTNTAKNEIIRNSGYRYVDIAELVGASDEDSEWYSGLLSGDNVHPTELGRKLIASKFIADVPEMY